MAPKSFDGFFAWPLPVGQKLGRGWQGYGCEGRQACQAGVFSRREVHRAHQLPVPRSRRLKSDEN